MIKMRRLALLVTILITVMSISTYVSAQEEIKVFSIDDIIPGDGQVLLFAGYQILTGCDSQQGCGKEGKLSWYLYEDGKFYRVDFGRYTPLFWWNGWILAKIIPYHLSVIRMRNWSIQPLFNMSIHMWNMYFNGNEIVIAEKNGYYNSTTLYFFNGTLPMRSLTLDGEVVDARYGNEAWIFSCVKRIRKGSEIDYLEEIHVLKNGKIFTFNTSHFIEDYSFNGTHLLIEINDYINKTPWYALYLWNLTSSEFILNITYPYIGLSVYGWNGTWYLGDEYSLYSQNPQLYRLEGHNLTPTASGYVYVEGYRNISPKLVVGNKIISLRGLAETRVRIEHYLGSMDYWSYLRGTAPFGDGVAYIRYKDKERKLVIVRDGMRQVFPLGEYFGGFSIIPAGKELFIYSYWNDGSSRLYIYREGKLEELTDKLKDVSTPLKMEEFRIESVFPWSKGLFLIIKPLWEGRLLYYYNWTNFTLIGLNFKPLGGLGEFYVLNSQGGISYLYNGSCLWKADTLHGEYAGKFFIARNGTATEIYNVSEKGFRRVLYLGVPLKFLYRTGSYLIFQQEGTDIWAIFNGTSFIRLPVKGHVLELPDDRVAILEHGNLYFWNFKNLEKIGEFTKNLVPVDYKGDMILGEPAPSKAFKSLYFYNGSLNMLFPPKNDTLYYYLNGTVLEQKCRFFLFKRCNYTVFDLSRHRLGEFTGKDYFGYSFWNGSMYFTNGTHLIEMSGGNPKSIKLPFEIEGASMVSSKRGLVVFGGDKLLLYNGTFRNLSGEFLSAYRNQPYYPSTQLKLCKKVPFKKSDENITPSSPSSSISSQTSSSTSTLSYSSTQLSNVSTGIPWKLLGGLAVILLIGIIYKMRGGR